MSINVGSEDMTHDNSFPTSRNHIQMGSTVYEIVWERDVCVPIIFDIASGFGTAIAGCSFVIISSTNFV